MSWFLKKVTEQKSVFLFPLQFLSEKYLILRRTEQDMIINMHWSSCKILQTGFQKINKYQISWKFIQWEPRCFMRTNGRTGMAKLIVPCLNFANTPKNYWRVCKILNSCKCGFKLMSSKYRTKSLKIQPIYSSFCCISLKKVHQVKVNSFLVHNIPT
jgi:hypothetical protein